jgi:hypothetical protein
MSETYARARAFTMKKGGIVGLILLASHNFDPTVYPYGVGWFFLATGMWWFLSND